MDAPNQEFVRARGPRRTGRIKVRSNSAKFLHFVQPSLISSALSRWT
jgi:hypothetical protein